MMMVTGFPVASLAAYPNMRSAAGFQEVMMPSRFFPMMASSEDCTRFVRSAPASSDFRRLPIDGKDKTRANMVPSESLDGGPVVAIGILGPLFAINVV